MFSYKSKIVPYSAMTQLTPDKWSFVFEWYAGLRDMADEVNARVSEWFRGELGSKANIVSADFVRGTTLVDTAIYWNHKNVNNLKVLEVEIN